MHLFEILLAACLLKNSFGTPVSSHSTLQVPLEYLTEEQASSRQLHGRFLHITDLHPDPFYKLHSSTQEDDACHRGKGAAGAYGAETTDCDTPFALVNATFKWIEENLRDTIDFVIWTGDSARHDSDEDIPRTQDEVLSTNRWVANKFAEVFRDPEDPDSLGIPVVSTFGNNDILPHNILLSGPNRWLATYTDIWNKFIPEEQRHGFERGGWYYVEVIPNKLAVFSLNTLYFFKNNAAVDGCALRSEPGYEHFEWLRIQLQFMRKRGMKAILTGHVPPARTESKQLWDETCWQKYTLWLHQYRDVVIGGLYGHMNIDHFMLQDYKEVDLILAGGELPEMDVRAQMDDELTIESASDYLEELRDNWSSLPNPSLAFKEVEALESEVDIDTTKKKKKKPKKTKKEKALKKMGGPWGERFQVTFVAPSLVPNFFPTLRVVEYNISGLDLSATWANTYSKDLPQRIEWLDEDESFANDDSNSMDERPAENPEEKTASKKKKPKKPKKPKHPDLVIPSPPSKSSPPGPGYSPQTLTLTGYTQYFANLTYLNNDKLVTPDESDDIDADKWHEGKHKGKHSKDKAHPKPFQFQIEYSTFTDHVYKLTDMTVKSYLKLAHRIGQFKPENADDIETLLLDEEDVSEDGSDDDSFKVDRKHKKKKKQHSKNKVWLHFVQRAFVQTLEDEDLLSFGFSESAFREGHEQQVEMHDGEL